MIPWRFTQWLTANRMHCRRELIIALHLIAACVIAHLFLDRWLVVLLSEFRQSPAVLVLSFVPDRVQLSILFTFGMLFLIAYRAITGDRFLADRGMFVLGCGAAAGFAAHVLKIVFGRVPPEVAEIQEPKSTGSKTRGRRGLGQGAETMSESDPAAARRVCRSRLLRLLYASGLGAKSSTRALKGW
jgi:hypothetical protein